MVVASVIPIAWAVPVINPKIFGFFIIGSTELVNVTAVANPTPNISPNKIASLIECGLIKFTKTATTRVVTKHEKNGTIKYIEVSFQ